MVAWGLIAITMAEERELWSEQWGVTLLPHNMTQERQLK